MMPKQIPLTPAALLACAALACGPKSDETATNASESAGTSTGPGTSSTTGTTEVDPGTATTTTATTGTPTTTSVEPTTAGTTTMGQDPHPAAACSLVPDPGSCDAAFERFFFNPQTQQCEVFTWGGCDGVVPFEDFAECQNACDSCEVIKAVEAPAAVFPPVEVAIRNDTAANIFLRSFVPAGGATPYRLEAFAVWPDGADAPLAWVPNSCSFPCGEVPFDDMCNFGCSDSGPPPAPILIVPGGVWRGQWGAQHMATVELPALCLPDGCDQLQCGRWLDASPGGYELRAAAATMWQCEMPDCCTPNADGWCQIDGFGTYDYGDNFPLTTATPFSFPGGPVELAFQ